MFFGFARHSFHLNPREIWCGGGKKPAKRQQQPPRTWPKLWNRYRFFLPKLFSLCCTVVCISFYFRVEPVVLREYLMFFCSKAAAKLSTCFSLCFAFFLFHSLNVLVFLWEYKRRRKKVFNPEIISTAERCYLFCFFFSPLSCPLTFILWMGPNAVLEFECEIFPALLKNQGNMFVNCNSPQKSWE